ncbi:hypothetical protein [Klebsiella oxytoca]|uniref:hypothetical protein n=1 Tax=Klebsiella oxytoca TaxID=571 RepID=UPI0034D181D8
MKSVINISILAITVLLSGCNQDSSGKEPSEPEIKNAMTHALQQQNRKLRDVEAKEKTSGKDAEYLSSGMLRLHESTLYSLEKQKCRSDKSNTVFKCDVMVDMDAGFGRTRQNTSLILMKRDSGWTVLI